MKWILILLWIGGCAERIHPSRETHETNPPTPPVLEPQATVVLPERVASSRSYLVRMTQVPITVASPVTLAFHVIDSDFDPVDLDDLDTTIVYSLPGATDIAATEVAPLQLRENKIEGPFTFTRAGKWRIQIRFEDPDEEDEDEIVFFDLDVR